MASRKKTEPDTSSARRRPATTPESRENQLIAAAVDLAEKQIREGTVSSQVLTHYLKLGSTREKLEQERLRNENHVLKAKAEAMASAKKVEELYGLALNAMRSYAGQDPISLGEEFDDG
uniref:Terminase small subunit n=1 Tax=Gordonia phage Petito TaxID=3158876 RepID=A0AAU8GPJ0_9CAUD